MPDYRRNRVPGGTYFLVTRVDAQHRRAEKPGESRVHSAIFAPMAH